MNANNNTHNNTINKMNGKNYRAPQLCVVQDASTDVLCTSSVDDMNPVDGEWDSDLVW